MRWITRPVDTWRMAEEGAYGVRVATHVASWTGPVPRDEPPTWNPVVRGWSLQYLGREVLLTELQFELTRKLAGLQRLRAADPSGAWPASVPGIEESGCPFVRWVYLPQGPVLLEPKGDAVGPLEGWSDYRDMPPRYAIGPATAP